MILRPFLPACATLFLLPTLLWAIPPGNDQFANATLLEGNFGYTSGDNIDASVEPGEPFHAGNSGGGSVWYYWNVPRQGLYRFDTQSSNFDTLLAIYSGSSVGALSLISENDQAGGLSTSSTVFSAFAGEELEIAVDGYNDAAGNLQLTWEQINPPQADFDNDNLNDFLLFSPYSGAIRYTYLSDTFKAGSGSGPTVPDPYEVSDTADFNFDEQPDIVLRNVRNNRTVIWLMSAGNFSSAYTAPTLPANYYLAAVDDFNDDGEEDYLIAHRSNGRTAVWNLSQGAFVSASNGPRLPVGWEIAGAADIDTDGNPDIVITNKQRGKIAFWLWDGSQVTATLRGPTVPVGYRLTGVGDYNRDGSADLVIVSTRTGKSFFWKMNGASFVSSSVGPKIASGYGIAAPR
jgi:hypothetical protein